MEVGTFFNLLFRFYRGIIEKLDEAVLTFGDVSASFLQIISALIIFSAVFGILWKGAKG